MASNNEKNDKQTTEEEEEMVDITSHFLLASTTLSYSNPLLCCLSEEDADKEEALRLASSSVQNNVDDKNIRPPVFNLQDSMAALEIMDPIMDCCEIPIDEDVDNDKNDDKKKKKKKDKSEIKTMPPRNTPTSLKSFQPQPPFTTPTSSSFDASLPWDKVSLKDASLISLETLTKLESNLRGASVAESTYTCLYAHDGVLFDMGCQLGILTEEKIGESEGEGDGDLVTKEKEGEKEKDGASTAAKAFKKEKVTSPKAAQTVIFTTALSLVKLTETIRAIIMHADIYEEEDYSISSSSFTFFCNVVREDLFREILGETLEMLKGMKVKEKEEQECVRVLVIVLEFYQCLFEVCASLAKLTAKTVRTTTKETQIMVQKCVTQLDELSTLLSSTKETKDENKILTKTFDSNINRRLLGNAPVRKVQFLTHHQTIQSLRTILHQIDSSVCDLLLLQPPPPHNHTSLQRIQRQLSHISTIPNINILCRSLIVLNLYFDDLLLGQYVLSDIIAQHMMSTAGVPPQLLNAEYGKSFLHRLGKPLYDTLKVLMLNRNRQRAYMDALMMREWAALQREGSAVDYYYKEDECNRLKSSPTTTTATTTTATPFVTNYVLSIGVYLMEHHLGLGIELDLYQGEFDLSIAYWYWDFLLSTRLNVVTTMRKEVMECKVLEAKRKQEQLIMEEREKKAKAAAAALVEAEKEHGGRRNHKGKKKGRRGGGGAGGKRSGGGGAKSAAGGGGGGSGQGSNSQSTAAALAATTSALTPTEEDAEDDMEFIFLGLRRLLCRGIVRFIAALNQAGLVTPPVFEFTSHERRFEKRFESFSVIPQPPPLTYDDYCQGSDFSKIKPEELLASAAECFKASKAAVDRLLMMLNQRSEASSTLPSTTASADDEKSLKYLPVSREEVMALAKVCVGNSLFLHKLTQQVKSGDKVSGKVSIDFSAHKQFCSIKIT